MRNSLVKYIPYIFLLLFALSAGDQLSAQKKMTDKQLKEYRRLYEIGEYERIISIIQENDFELDYDLLVLSGNVFHKMEDHENAIQAYSQALHIDDNPEILVLRAAAYLDLGIMDLCLEDINEAKRRSSNNPYLFFTLGNYSLDMGDLRNAIKYYRKSIEIDSNDEKAFFMMAVAYNEMGNYKRSIEIFETLSNVFPQAKYNIAINYLQNDQPEVANELLDDLETVYKSNADYYFFRAESKYFQQDKTGACLDYKQAADMGDDEAASIFNKFCIQNKKKAKSDRIKSGSIKF